MGDTSARSEAGTPQDLPAPLLSRETSTPAPPLHDRLGPALLEEMPVPFGRKFVLI